MVIDSVKNLDLYMGINSYMQKAHDFLQANSTADIACGRHELGDGCYVNVFEYTTAERELSLESHEQYIDVQVMLCGQEKMLWQLKQTGTLTKEYNSIDDYALWTAPNCTEIVADEGMFCVFFPWDLHQPSILYNSAQVVKKAVFKFPVKNVFIPKNSYD